MRRRLLLAVILLGAGLFVYGRSLGFPFLDFDDPVYVQGNPFLRDRPIAGLAAVWTTPYFHDFIPVTHTTLWLDHRLWGDRAFGYRLTSLLWHLVAAALAGSVLGRLAGDRRVGVATGLLFAVHPLAVESVAWVASRKNVVSLSLLFAAVELFQRSADAATPFVGGVGANIGEGSSPPHLGGRPGGTTGDRMSASGAGDGRWVFIGGAATAGILFVLSVLSKSSSIVFPGLVFVDLRLRKRIGWRRSAVIAAPYAAVSVAAALLTISLRHDQPEGRLGGSLPATLLADLPIAARYLLNTIWPFSLSLFYAVSAGAHLGAASILGAGGVLAAALATPFLWLRRRTEGAALLAWAAIGLLTASNIVPQPHPIADRFFYWSLPPLIAFYVLAAIDALERISPPGGRARRGPARGSHGGESAGAVEPGETSPGAEPGASRENGSRAVDETAPVSLRPDRGARRWLPIGALAAVAVVLAAAAHARASLFGSSLALFEEAVRKDPESAIANMHLANTLTPDPGSQDRVAGLFRAMFAAPDAGDLLKPAARDGATLFLAIWDQRHGRAGEADRLIEDRFGPRGEEPAAVLARARYELAANRAEPAAARLETSLFGSRPDGRPRIPGLEALRDRLMASAELPWMSRATLAGRTSDAYRRGQEAMGLLSAVRLLGQAYRTMGRTGSALGMSLVAASMDPDDPGVLADLAADYRSAGDEARARAAEDRASSLRHEARAGDRGAGPAP